MINNKELHLFIIWERGRYKEKEILCDIRKKFSIVRLYDNTWSPQYVSSNFTRFYGVNLPSNSEKEKECGTNSFLLVIVFDNNPIYDFRETSHGLELVNINMFDSKALYRSWTGGGHKIHGTNSTQETNHDITLLLGLNTEDYLNTLSSKHYCDIPEKINKDISGANGWFSLNELFYILNNTIEYVILRGSRELISDSFTDTHRDVDIFVTDYQNTKYIINGVSDCNTFRPHERIIINNKTYYIDIWRANYNYFDPSWSNIFLKNKKSRDGYFVLDDYNDFYLLLYHCLIIKGRITEDYKERIEKFIEVNKLVSQLDLLLLDFLKKHDYSITKPKDRSLTLHFQGTIKEYIKQYGILIKTLEQDNDNGLCYISKVYEKDDSFVKVGTPWLIDNEYIFLKRLEKYDLFPKVLSYIKGEKESVLEITRLEGNTIDDFFMWRNHLCSAYMKSFVQEVCNIIDILRKEHIIHRDFIPQNLLILENGYRVRVNLIDFGWAIDEKEINTCRKPLYLAGLYRPKDNMYSDSYTFGRSLVDINKDKWHDMPYTRKCAARLISGSTDISDIKVTILDEYRLFLYRHQKVFKLHKCVFRQLKNVCRKILKK